jgi:hypothetical protein
MRVRDVTRRTHALLRVVSLGGCGRGRARRARFGSTGHARGVLRRDSGVRGILHWLSLERLDALTQPGVVLAKPGVAFFEVLDALAQPGVFGFERIKSLEENLKGGGLLSHRPHRWEECFDLVSLSNSRADVKGA